jgi:hypothetical protein
MKEIATVAVVACCRNDAQIWMAFGSLHVFSQSASVFGQDQGFRDATSR